MDLLSVRPRTLSELSRFSGISVQGVLRHLNKLQASGLLIEKNFRSKELPIRRLYSLSGSRIHDYSVGNLSIIKRTESSSSVIKSKLSVRELESMAEERIVLRRRVNDRVRKLGRAIDELVGIQTRLVESIESLGLGEEDQLILLIVFTEETLQDAEKVLKNVHRISDPRKAVDRALARVSRNAKR
ncbi:MAG: winged helix-turn-helix transcriptional regulator [Thaumarchaeota archaeon]|nr:winged helix-turn-helix transcriptional regulator [Nitrososphaerota archaeon]